MLNPASWIGGNETGNELECAIEADLGKRIRQERRQIEAARAAEPEMIFAAGADAESDGLR
jgi:hypothetical protein